MSGFVLSVGTRAGWDFQAPLQDAITAAFCVAGFMLLAAAAYLLRKNPEQVEVRADALASADLKKRF